MTPSRPYGSASTSRSAVRVLGLDLGSRRIGVAVSDGTGTLASPLTVLERSADPARDRKEIARVVREEEAERVVVGMPTSLSGEPGPAAKAALAETAALSDALDVPVVAWDERFTTVIASRAMTGTAAKKKRARAMIDAAAAAVMLQSWLDANRSEVDADGS
jgi:putative holliday junction resolvase